MKTRKVIHDEPELTDAQWNAAAGLEALLLARQDRKTTLETILPKLATFSGVPSFVKKYITYKNLDELEKHMQKLGFDVKMRMRRNISEKTLHKITLSLNGETILQSPIRKIKYSDEKYFSESSDNKKTSALQLQTIFRVDCFPELDKVFNGFYKPVNNSVNDIETPSVTYPGNKRKRY